MVGAAADEKDDSRSCLPGPKGVEVTGYLQVAVAFRVRSCSPVCSLVSAHGFWGMVSSGGTGPGTAGWVPKGKMDSPRVRALGLAARSRTDGEPLPGSRPQGRSRGHARRERCSLVQESPSGPGRRLAHAGDWIDMVGGFLPLL